jgi:hypothetical protein
MSSSFSYELDEEQIRSTLLSGGLTDPMESAWDDFESNYDQAATVSNTIKFKLPEFNLNINRNVVLPVLFIAGLVGVSAIMLSFVDFKTNVPSKVEKGLIPNPDNYKGEEAKAAVLMKKEPIKAEEKPVVKTETVTIAPQSQPIQTLVPQVQYHQPTVNPNYAARTNEGAVQNPSITSEITKPVTAVVDTTAARVNNSGQINPDNQNYGRGRKKRRKLPPEQIETIKAPSILVESAKKEEEPEMEIKLN